MPLYNYECPKCGEIYTKFLKAEDRNNVYCDECGTKLNRTYGIPIIEFRDHNTGWAKKRYQNGFTDYNKFTERTNYEIVYNNKKIFNKLPRQTQVQYEREISKLRWGGEE